MARVTRRTLMAGAAVLAWTGPVKAGPAFDEIEREAHERAMRLAIAVARRNPRFPFGAVMVRAADGSLLAEGVNDSRHNPVLHGEIVCINAYVAAHGNVGWEERCSTPPPNRARCACPRSSGRGSGRGLRVPVGDGDALVGRQTGHCDRGTAGGGGGPSVPRRAAGRRPANRNGCAVRDGTKSRVRHQGNRVNDPAPGVRARKQGFSPSSPRSKATENREASKALRAKRTTVSRWFSVALLLGEPGVEIFLCSTHGDAGRSPDCPG